MRATDLLVTLSGLVCFSLTLAEASINALEGEMPPQSLSTGPVSDSPSQVTASGTGWSEPEYGREDVVPVIDGKNTSQAAYVTRRMALNAPGMTTPVTPGLYTIQSVGRSCRPYLSVNGDCSDVFIDTWFTQDGSGRQVFNLQQPNPSVNAFTITVNGGRSTCDRKIFSMQACGGNNYPDLWLFNDGSGRQLFAFDADPFNVNQYQITAIGRPSCDSFLTMADCSSNDLIARFSSVTSGTPTAGQRWTVQPISGTPTPTPTTPPPPPPPPPTTSLSPLLASGRYTLYNGHDGACQPYASVASGCGDPTLSQSPASATFPNPGDLTFQLTLMAGTASTFMIASTTARQGCSYTSAIRVWQQDDCTGSTAVTTQYPGSQAAAVQQYFNITPGPVTSSGQAQYYIIGLDRTTDQCAKYVSLAGCSNSNKGISFVNPYNGINPPGDAAVLWTIRPQAPPASYTGVLANGNYRIQVVGRSGCESWLVEPNCAVRGSPGNPGQYNTTQPQLSANAADARGVWYLNFNQAPGTFFIFGSTAGCPAGLAASELAATTDCTSPQGNVVQLYDPEDSGRDQWSLNYLQNGADPNAFEVQNLARASCGAFLSVQVCGGNLFPDLYFTDDLSGRQVWRFVPA